MKFLNEVQKRGTLSPKKMVQIEPVAGASNLADLGTKVLPLARLSWLREGCGLVEIPAPAASRVASVGNAARAVDHMNLMTVLRVLTAMVAMLPRAVSGSSTELCEVQKELTGDISVTLTAPAGSMGVFMAGVTMGFVIAALIAALICCACPCMRPVCSSTSHALEARPKKGGARKRSVVTQSQTKFTWYHASPGFQPLPAREHGAWVE